MNVPKQNSLKFVSIFLTIFPFASLFSQIQNVVNSVNLDSLIHCVKELSSETALMINGNPDTILSRYKNFPGNEKAEILIYNRLQRFGLSPQRLIFSSTGKNVYAIQQGSLYPEQQYIICAHYDDYPVNLIAPGADDNASGVATVLEAARILAKFSSDYSIIYALWDEEEQGLVGSAAYASWANSNNHQIKGVINIDMIGWDSDSNGVFLINTRDIASSYQLRDSILAINNFFQLGLTPQVVDPGSGSDNLPFWYYGFGAIGIEEDYFNDWNSNYHTVNDRVSEFNTAYFHRCAKVVIGALAALAEINSTVQIEQKPHIAQSLELYQNYPNPFNPVTHISYKLEVAGAVSLKIFDVIGREVEVLVNKFQSAGEYRYQFIASYLPSGLYLYKLQVGDLIKTKKMVLLK